MFETLGAVVDGLALVIIGIVFSLYRKEIAKNIPGPNKRRRSQIVVIIAGILISIVGATLVYLKAGRSFQNPTGQHQGQSK